MRLKSLPKAAPIVALFISNPNNEQHKPNIFIPADNFSWNNVSYNATKYYETPNIDRIASQGIIFTNGYANCQVSSPLRASLLTGQFTARHGITDWIGAKAGQDWRNKKRFSKLIPANYKQALPHNITKLPEALKEKDFLNFFAEKWHIGGIAFGDSYTTSNKPLKAGKRQQFEGGIRISVPWMELNGQKCNVPVVVSDLYPTLLDLVDIPIKPDQHIDGVSLKPLLEGGTINESFTV